MIDKFSKIIIFLIIPVIAGRFCLKQPEKANTVTTAPTTVISAEDAEPPSTQFSPQDYIREVFGPDAPIALAVAQTESGIVSKQGGRNRNGTYDWGIFQINDCHCKKIEGDCHSQLLDPKFNINFAKKIFDSSGWYPWSTFKNGKYRRYL